MHRSLTAQLPLSRYRIDRDHLTRERPRLFEELAEDPRTRVIALWRGEVLIAEDDEAPALEYLVTDTVPEGLLRIYLGRALDVDPALPAGSPIVAAVFDDEAAKALDVDIARWRSPRTLGHRLGDRDAGLAIEALGIANWHETHRFSPRTGHSTTPAKGGWVRIDDEDGQEMFPRTDAAIIVGITDAQDRLVLGSNALWESNRFSLLAGFVEPGESLEAAVVRDPLRRRAVCRLPQRHGAGGGRCGRWEHRPPGAPRRPPAPGPGSWAPRWSPQRPGGLTPPRSARP